MKEEGKVWFGKLKVYLLIRNKISEEGGEASERANERDREDEE